jgi:hypothetical protein
MLIRVTSCLLLSASAQDLFLQTDARGPIDPRADPLQAYRQSLKNSLLMHGVDQHEAHATASAWPFDHGDDPHARELPVWGVEDWKTFEHASYIHEEYGFVVKKVTYTSPQINLKTGEAHFTLNPLTHSPFPKGDYSLMSNKYRVVQDDEITEVPLSEVYLHHWLMGDNVDVNPLQYCQNDYYWGYGAEMHNMTYTVPKGYAMKRIGSKGHCGLNMHFIRVEDLQLEWEGFNNPNGSWGAAVKNCAECGWAPGRAVECEKVLDGTFACCFTKSRCPNNGKITGKKSYKLQYDIEYTEDLAALKPLRGVVLDLSGGAIEWNIDANMRKRANTECGDKACVTKDTWTVGHQKGFGRGICAGTMMWSYTHQHLGAINSTMFLNDKPYCTGFPVHGTDPTNPPGNEKGFVVKFTDCVSRDGLGNQVRLNAGDKLRIEAWYDVDKDSVGTLPLPGGKHGGVMDLFFAMMDCDPGTFGEIYVCRQSTCVPSFKSNIDRKETHYDTIDACQAACK